MEISPSVLDDGVKHDEHCDEAIPLEIFINLLYIYLLIYLIIHLLRQFISFDAYNKHLC